jgi:hypothetical protein
MDRILNMKTFGMRIRFTEKAGARVTWMNRCQQVSIDKISFSVGNLTDALHLLRERCQDRLTKQLMFLQEEEQLPILHLTKKAFAGFYLLEFSNRTIMLLYFSPRLTRTSWIY